ncbi:MAG: hypothetical protein ACOVMT_02625 [Caulobacter sp.]
MPTQRAPQRASPRAPKPERIIMRMVVELQRVTQSSGAEPGRTLFFKFKGGTRRAERSLYSFVSPEHVPDFKGQTAWFEVEEVSGKPWSYWRAVRQVEPPADA